MEQECQAAEPRWTLCLRRCVEVAQVLALDDDGPVEVSHLVLAAALDADWAARSRLVMNRLGAQFFFTEEFYARAAQAAESRSTVSRAVRFSSTASAALARLPYWRSRTGDGIGDSSHLLMAGLEAGADDETVREIARETGTTVRDVVRTAMVVRHHVSADDRQFGVRGPILSHVRPNRPTPYRFENPNAHTNGAPTVRRVGLRSQTTGGANGSAHVQRYLLQLHVWVLSVLMMLVLVEWMAIALATVTFTGWSALWLANLLRRQQASITVRLSLDLVLVAASVVLSIPWWLVVIALLNRSVDIVEGRLGLLHVRADTADPALSEKTIRRDRRVNAHGSRTYAWLKLRGDTASR